MREKVKALRQQAIHAAQGISMNPERFGEGLLNDLENELTQFLSQIPEDIRDEYEDRYISKYKEWLGAMSRCFSAMVTGPAKFNNRRHEKTNAAEGNARKRLDEWAAKVIKRVNRQARLRGWEEVERLQNKLEQRTELQEQMKAANKIVRDRKLSEMDKLDELMALGISQSNANILLKPNHFGEYGFASYMLTNNNAEIRRLQDLISSKERLLGKEDREEEFDFGTIEFAYSDERIKIYFNGKPDEEVRSLLKGNGYHWSPKEGVWMRQITDRALSNLEHTVKPALLKTN